MYLKNISPEHVLLLDSAHHTGECSDLSGTYSEIQSRLWHCNAFLSVLYVLKITRLDSAILLASVHHTGKCSGLSGAHSKIQSRIGIAARF